MEKARVQRATAGVRPRNNEDPLGWFFGIERGEIYVQMHCDMSGGVVSAFQHVLDGKPPACEPCGYGGMVRISAPFPWPAVNGFGEIYRAFDAALELHQAKGA